MNYADKINEVIANAQKSRPKGFILAIEVPGKDVQYLLALSVSALIEFQKYKVDLYLAGDLLTTTSGKWTDMISAWCCDSVEIAGDGTIRRKEKHIEGDYRYALIKDPMETRTDMLEAFSLLHDRKTGGDLVQSEIVLKL